MHIRILVDMKIKILKLGELETNCYILKQDHEVIVIDPADEVDRIINEIGNDKLLGIIITHHHFDHVGALKDLKTYYDTNIYDRNNLEEKDYTLDKFNFDIIYTPGHTSDSISIYFKEEKIM